MNKISKSLKRMRIKEGLTQEALAQKLSVTRQTISSWETDRTQPDVNMIVLLSETLGVSVEELIYGEKRNVGLESDKLKYGKTVTVIFAVLGTLLVGSGLLMVFAVFWESFPLSLKAVLSFLPLILSQCFAVFVFLKKRGSTAFSESAAVLWVCGVIATVALVNDVLYLDNGFYNCILIDCVLTLPIIFILNSVSPLSFIYFAICLWSCENLYNYDNDYGMDVVIILVTTAVLAVTMLFIRFSKKYIDIVRQNIAKWMATAAIVIFLLMASDFVFGMIPFVLIFAALFSLDNGKKLSEPFYIPGLVGLLICASVCSSGTMAELVWLDKELLFLSFGTVASILIIILCVALMIVSTLRAVKTGLDKTRLILLISAVLISVFHFISFFGMTDFYFFAPFEKAVAILMGITLLVDGAKQKSFLSVNFGFLMLAIQIILIVVSLEFDLLGTGAACILLGGILLAVNFKMLATRKKSIVKTGITEVENDA